MVMDGRAGAVVSVGIEACKMQPLVDSISTSCVRNTHSPSHHTDIMDNILTEFFDPNSYHSHITPLESSAHAIRIAQQAKRIDRSRRGKRPVGGESRGGDGLGPLVGAAGDLGALVSDGAEDGTEQKHGDDLEGDNAAREALGDLARWLPVRPQGGSGGRGRRRERWVLLALRHEMRRDSMIEISSFHRVQHETVVSRHTHTDSPHKARRTKSERSRSSRANSLSRYYTTSALVRSMYPEPRSGKARQLMVHGGHATSSGNESPLHSIMRENGVGFAGDSQASREARATRKKLGKVALDKLRSRYEKDVVDMRKFHDRIGLLVEMA